jgi:hypothetical protein
MRSSVELPMFRVGLGGLSQEIGQHAIRKILRPTHRLCDAAPILDQAVDDLLRGRRSAATYFHVEHMFVYSRCAV